MIQRRTILATVNKVLSRLHLDEVTSIDSSNISAICLEKLNETIEHISDYATWPQLRREITVTAQSSVATIKINSTTEAIHHIESIYEGTSELNYVEPRDINRLQKTSRSFGSPTQWAFTATSGDRAIISMWPIPNSAFSLNIAAYVKPSLYTDSDVNSTCPLPAVLIEQGTYANMLLHESGGAETPEFQTEYRKFMLAMETTYNRYAGNSPAYVKFTYKV